MCLCFLLKAPRHHPSDISSVFKKRYSNRGTGLLARNYLQRKNPSALEHELSKALPSS
ncbi:hypothetical protein SK128_004563, partial [Halocaridina rubra]